MSRKSSAPHKIASGNRWCPYKKHEVAEAAFRKGVRGKFDTYCMVCRQDYDHDRYEQSKEATRAVH